MGGILRGFALGATGEEVLAVVAPFDAPTTRRFERMNLVTGVKSFVPLSPTWINNDIGQGDPTGFIYANVVDRDGDNDGDGVSSGGRQ